MSFPVLVTNANVSTAHNKSSGGCNPYEATNSPIDRAVMTAGYTILLVLSLVGNVFIIVVFYKRYQQLRTPVNYFIVNMAVSDLLVPVFVIPRIIQEIYLGWYPWPIGGVLGDILCRVVHFVDEVSVSVSSQSMVFIAAERFWSIVFRLKKPLISRRTTPRFISFTWVFSIIFYSYYLFVHKLRYKDNGPICDYDFPQLFSSWQNLWRADRLSLLIVFVVIPCVLLTVFYTTIIISLRRQERCAIHRAYKTQQRRAKTNQRIAVMLVIVVIVFFVSWAPYYVYFFLQYYSFAASLSCGSLKRLRLSGRLMNYLYTALNPLIYYVFNPIYHQGFHKLLCCPWKCLQPSLRSQQRPSVELVSYTSCQLDTKLRSGEAAVKKP